MTERSETVAGSICGRLTSIPSRSWGKSFTMGESIATVTDVKGVSRTRELDIRYFKLGVLLCRGVRD